MKKRDYRDYVQDIIDAINDLETFTKDMKVGDFVKDRKTVNAVIRSIEIIGEAAKKIPESIRRKNISIPWKKMTGMRDKLIHEYFGVDLETLWEVTNNDIPPLKPLIQNVLEELGK